ncbi:hypothetical protein [Micromonospora sp. NPDC005174]|uniref:hypothetical protein n=1 Tax=Micromonospora sp. NPDC005174 TaxID=3157018 RepID=UPI0033BD397E
MPIDMPPQVRSGDLLHLTRAASPQFARPITVRVIRALTDRHTYHGWLWIDAYQLGPNGDAVARRELYLMPAGARRLASPPAAPPRPAAPRRPTAPSSSAASPRTAPRRTTASRWSPAPPVPPAPPLPTAAPASALPRPATTPSRYHHAGAS